MLLAILDLVLLFEAHLWQLVLNLAQHNDAELNNALRLTPELVETLRTVVGSARAECPHLAHQMAAEALGILQDDTGLLPAGFMSRLPPPPVASEAGFIFDENEKLTAENHWLADNNQALGAAAFRLDEWERTKWECELEQAVHGGPLHALHMEFARRRNYHSEKDNQVRADYESKLK